MTVTAISRVLLAVLIVVPPVAIIADLARRGIYPVHVVMFLAWAFPVFTLRALDGLAPMNPQ